MPTGCVTAFGYVSDKTPPEGPSTWGAPRTYNSTYNRMVDHHHYLMTYSTPKVQLHHPGRSRRRPWDAPARQLNELGPNGYNFFRVAQTDEQRRWHQEQMAQSARPVATRSKEAMAAHGNLHQGSVSRLPALIDYPNEEDSDPRLLELSSAVTSSYRSLLDERPMTAPYASPAPAPSNFEDSGLPVPHYLRSPKPSMSELMHAM